MTATVTTATGNDGVLLTDGTQNAGLSFFVKDDHLWFDYNAFGDHTVLRSDQQIPTDARELTVRFERTKRTGSAELRTDVRRAAAPTSRTRGG